MSYKVGQRVSVQGKDVSGIIAYIGLTEFAPGKWIGVILDEPKGKNNGTVQGKEYFSCEDNRGMFVRQTQISAVNEGGASGASTPRSSATTPKGSAPPTPRSLSQSKIATPTSVKKGGDPKSRLPLPGQGPTGSRSPTYTNLKSKDKKEDKPKSQSMQRERSFVEKNFVQTLEASTASPQVSASPANTSLSDRLEEKVAALQVQQELTQAKEEVKDLNEKLETIKIKRAKDQEKLKDFEKLKLQVEQLESFKSRILESQSSLQKDLQRAKAEAQEAIQAKHEHADEMAELSENVEMLTLDREMAEEKAEAIQMELEAAKERIEELTLDLDIIKTEMGDHSGGADSGVTNFEVKQLAAQNEKLRETLVRMRDLSAHEKNEITKLHKDLEEKTEQLAALEKQHATMGTQSGELEQQIADLQEQVDAALGAEEMVETLTAKCLDLEDRVVALNEEKDDLETLCDMNEQLVEGARELEMELREELDLTHGKVREAERDRDAAYEIINDHEATIRKFRDLVTKVQEQNLDLRSALEKETNKPVSTPAEMIDFKKMLFETKAHSKAIDMDLRNCDVDQATRHVKYLLSYMSDSFLARGGDHEAVMVLLLVPRILWKASVLASRIKEKFPAPTGGIDRNTLLKGHSVERYSFGIRMIHLLECLTASLTSYQHALATCQPQTFLRVGTLFPEMSVHEKGVDFYIELLRKDQLDENVPVETLEKALHYFEHIYPLHLGEERLDHTSFLQNQLRVFESAADCLGSYIQIGKALMQDDASEMGVLLKTSEGEVNEIKTTVKNMKRRMPQDLFVQFPNSSAARLRDTADHLMLVVRSLYQFGKSATQQAGLLPDPEHGVPTGKLVELLHAAIDKTYESNDGGLDSMRNSLQAVLKNIQPMNKQLQDGDWDLPSPPDRPPQPVVVRAETYKAELKEAEGMRFKLENKDLDIKDLKKLVKTKNEELSEMQVRKDMVEKKLLDVSRDSELMIEKLQRKLEDANGLLRRKEKEFEETMDHLQADIDCLEMERGELKDKVKNMAKRSLIEGIAKNQGPVSLGPSIPTPVKDSPMLLQQMQDLQTAMLSIRENSYRQQGEALRRRVAQLKPIVLPKRTGGIGSPAEEKSDLSKDDQPDINQLLKRTNQLMNAINKSMSSAEVVDITKRNGGRTELLVSQAARHQRLKAEAEQLTIDVRRLMASKKPGGEVEAAFCTFPSPQMAKAMGETGYTLAGRVHLPTADVKVKSVPLLLGFKDMQAIHQKVMG